MTKRILIVEDDGDTVYLLQMLMTRQGYSVTTARNGQEALACVATQSPDLVIMDVEMPELSGLETLQQLRANPPTAQLPVILLTGRKNLSDIAEGVRAGADFYLSKPFGANDVVEFVRSVLEDNS